MERHGEEVEVTTEEASAASRPHIVRYILVISLALAVIAMTLVWVVPALTG